ncbi:MAG: hypothetical protein OJF50_006385 [Nitrospira sp.]|nr:hypothetical protein [Nitrospira sp.]
MKKSISMLTKLSAMLNGTGSAMGAFYNQIWPHRALDRRAPDRVP